ERPDRCPDGVRVLAAQAHRATKECKAGGEESGTQPGHHYEFQPESGVWTVPPDHMKAGKEHRVPLSSDAIKLLSSAASDGTTDASTLVFPGVKSESKLSDMTFTAALK